MADSSPLDGLLDRAGNVFTLAGKLGGSLQAEFQKQGLVETVDSTDWNRHASDFDAFCSKLLELRDSMQNPPDGFASVAEHLLAATRIVREIETIQSSEVQNWAACWKYFPHLKSLAVNGRRAVEEVTQARRLDDPFDLVQTPTFTLLDRFPETAAGHVKFLEDVRDVLHFAAEAKRNQIQERYSNEVIENTVRGVRWAEAGQRVLLIPGLSPNVVEEVASVLRRELTRHTMEQLDELFTSAMRKLRDAWEDRDALPHVPKADELGIGKTEAEQTTRKAEPAEQFRPLPANTIELAGKFYELTPRAYKLAKAILDTEDWKLDFSDFQEQETGSDAFDETDLEKWRKRRTEFNKATVESGYKMSISEKNQWFEICIDYAVLPNNET